MVHILLPDIVDRLRKGEFIRPVILEEDDISPKVTKLMQQCWSSNESERPVFTVIRSYIKKNVQEGVYVKGIWYYVIVYSVKPSVHPPIHPKQSSNLIAVYARVFNWSVTYYFRSVVMSVCCLFSALVCFFSDFDSKTPEELPRGTMCHKPILLNSVYYFVSYFLESQIQIHCAKEKGGRTSWTKKT